MTPALNPLILRPIATKAGRSWPAIVVAERACPFCGRTLRVARRNRHGDIVLEKPRACSLKNPYSSLEQNDGHFCTRVKRIAADQSHCSEGSVCFRSGAVCSPVDPRHEMKQTDGDVVRAVPLLAHGVQEPPCARLSGKGTRRPVNSLSMNAHNVEIITSGGTVTFRGPVKSPEENATIGCRAKQVADVTRLDNLLESKRSSFHVVARGNFRRVAVGDTRRCFSTRQQHLDWRSWLSTERIFSRPGRPPQPDGTA